jgi:hypothetical protein
MVGRFPVRFLLQESTGFSIPTDSKSGQFKVRTLLSKNPQFWPLISGMSGDLKLLIVMTVKAATTAQTESLLCTNLYKIGAKKEHSPVHRESTNAVITSLHNWQTTDSTPPSFAEIYAVGKLGGAMGIENTEDCNIKDLRGSVRNTKILKKHAKVCAGILIAPLKRPRSLELLQREINGSTWMINLNVYLFASQLGAQRLPLAQSSIGA